MWDLCPAGNYLGQVIAGLSYPWIIVPIGMLIGYFIVKAEPAVYVLTEQVEELTSGAISAKAMGMSLSIGVAFSLGLAMVRCLQAFRFCGFCSQIRSSPWINIFRAKNIHSNRI